MDRLGSRSSPFRSAEHLIIHRRHRAPRRGSGGTAYYFLISRVLLLTFAVPGVPYPCHNGAEKGIAGQHWWN